MRGPSSTPGMSDHGLEIYKTSLFANLSAVLGAGFPIVREVVGSACFNGLCRQFIPNHLPASAKLSAYGGAFPDYLASRAELAELPYLPDLAKLEWQIKRLLIAKDHPKDPGFEPSAKPTLQLAPWAATFSACSNVVALRHWHYDRISAPPAMTGCGRVQHWLLFRQGRQIADIPLSATESTILTLIGEQRDSLYAVDQLTRRFGEADVEACLVRFISMEILQTYHQHLMCY